MLSILILVCQSAFVRTEVTPAANTKDSSDAEADVELSVKRMGQEAVPEPTIAETMEVSVDDLESEGDHKLKCDGEPELVQEPDDEPTDGSSYLEVSEADLDVKAAFMGSCDYFKGTWGSHFYKTDVGAEKNVLYLYPSDDHNNAFALNNNLCSRLRSWHDEATSVHVYHAKSVQHAQNIVETYPRDSLMLAVLGGHGSATSLHWGEGSSCGSSHLCSNGYRTKRFFKTLASRIPEHGSIFMDSCLTASEDRSLSWWVSQQVQKGIRVMGSPVSFSSVYWGRFGAGNYVEAVRADGKRVQVIHYKTGGRCPSFSKSSYPNEHGECECPRDKKCWLGWSKCPLVRKGSGGESSRYFVPGCATIGDKEGKCKCS